MHISILIFGDSISWGCWDPKKGGWADRLKAHFQNKNYRDLFRVYISNLSVGGENTNYLLERFQNETKTRDMADKQKMHNIIIFAIGINDSCKEGSNKVDFRKFQKNLIELIKQARKFTRKIVFIGLNKVNMKKVFPTSLGNKKNYDNENIIKYDLALRKICLENEICFIPMFDLLKDTDLEDGVHPNSQGHQKIFKKVKNFLLDNKLIGM